MNHHRIKISRMALVLLGCGGALLVAISNLPAALLQDDSATHIEINGVDFGQFHSIQGLDQLTTTEGSDSDNVSLGTAKSPSTSISNDRPFATISIKREFVTDPSLYLWARNHRSRMSEVMDIHLVTRNAEGTAIRRQILKSCQPLSWSVEAINPSLGGFNETIDLSVQNIAVF